MDYTGGCQCGAMRYRAEGPYTHSSVCYCGMCQKASGGPFMVFVRFPADKVQWSKPLPVFASSPRVERGFCRDCGTPLTYRRIDSHNISVTANSLDDPAAIQPTSRFSVEREVPWCATLANLPAAEPD
jgi:hypothetical protein